MLGRKPELVGVLGLGIVGQRVARVLREGGNRVYVWNRTPKEEPNFLGSPAEVAGHAETIQLFLKDGPACLEVMDNLKMSLTSKHLVINSSSIHPDDTKRVCATVLATGARYVEAPFTGSREAAAQGKLNYYVSGDLTSFEKARPILEKSSAAIVPLGETVGTASLIKIVTNLISAATVAVLAESVALLRKHELDPDLLGKALEVNANRSGLTSMKLPAMIAGDFSPHFSLGNMLKDVLIGTDLAAQEHLDIPVIQATADALREGADHGRSGLDFAALLLNHADQNYEASKASR